MDGKVNFRKILATGKATGCLLRPMKHNICWMLAGALTLSSGVSMSSCSTPSSPHPLKHPGGHSQFDSLDTNHDSRLSYSEMMKLPLMRKASDPAATFAQMDLDADGYVSLTEFHAYRLKNKKS